MIGLGLLEQVGDAYPVLTMTGAGVALLKDERAVPNLVLARQRTPPRDRRAPVTRVEAESWDGVDRDLFDRLRAVRLEVARSRGVPPYVIFHDATLRDMARRRPTTVPGLLDVRGVGARKADDLGETFLAAIRAHVSAT
jgi:ATP-dependent DNA helicase RecQ